MKYVQSRAVSGFSLVELMISMTLGLILIGGVVTMYLSSKRTMHTTEASSQLQEISRFALDRISFDVRMSGFWGCNSIAAPVINGLNPSTNLLDFAAGPLDGTDNDGVNDSDTLRVAYASDQTLELLADMTDATAPLLVSDSSGLAEGDLIVANDCDAVDIFQMDGKDPAAPDKLFHTAGGSAVPGNSAASLSKPYGAGAEVYKIIQATWAIGTTDQAQPVLLRNGVEFVDGVENLQIVYGLDSNNDGSVDRYVNASQVVNWNLVLNLKIGLLIRSEREAADNISPPFTFWNTLITPTDRYIRRGFSVVVGVRNRLP